MNAETGLLFLGFEGVVHGEPNVFQHPFGRLKFLENVLRESSFQGVNIVIASEWREYESLAELRENFSPDIRNRVIDVTPVMLDFAADWPLGQEPKHERQWEIELWMKLNRPQGTPWAAVNCTGGFESDLANVTVPKSKHGLGSLDVNELRSKLRRTMRLQRISKPCQEINISIRARQTERMTSRTVMTRAPESADRALWTGVAPQSNPPLNWLALARSYEA